MKIECHVLQNFAPSCLNRDDTNTPKECEFGGVRRARISSQSFKRAIREHFKNTTQAPNDRRAWTDEHKRLIGERTKAVRNTLITRLGEGSTDKVEAFVRRFLSDFDEKRPVETEVLIFISHYEIEAMASCIEENVTDKKMVAKRIAEAQPSVDVALFGRMLANKSGTNKAHVDRIQLSANDEDHAACQVGHALSTHAAELEMDFFTAVDDLNPRDDVGAGMLGYTGYNSACFYRYALLDTNQLRTNLGGNSDTLMKQAVEAFLWAFCDAEPSARQNSMPAHNRPSLVLFVAREKGVPTALTNAFCKPVSTRKTGFGNSTAEPDLIGDSVQALTRHYARMEEVYSAFEGTTQAVFHDLDEEEKAERLGALAAHDVGTQRKAIAKILGVI